MTQAFLSGPDRRDDEAAGRRETPPQKPPRGSWARQNAMLQQLRMQEGRTYGQIGLMLGRSAKAVERQLERMGWILYPRSAPPNALAEIRAAVAKLEAEEGGS